MPTVRYFQDAGGSIPVADYIVSLDRAGRGAEAARILSDIELLAEIGMAGAQQMGRSFSRLIDRELRIWELRPGNHRIAYAAIADELVLLHAWRKQTRRLDPRALQNAQRNYWRAVDRRGE
ncbi:MAG: type II toxin-antitoxin system RelE/ParE family toxin [Chloroflexota bacterium]|nr:type II toxin-antitoxin system RelE/ParE family toxin [Chloroflexota bacterium]